MSQYLRKHNVINGKGGKFQRRGSRAERIERSTRALASMDLRKVSNKPRGSRAKHAAIGGATYAALGAIIAGPAGAAVGAAAGAALGGAVKPRSPRDDAREIRAAARADLAYQAKRKKRAGLPK